MAGHVGSRIMLIIIVWAFLILDIIFRSLAINGQSVIFRNTTAVNNALYQTEITPDPFTYYIWIFIYICQVVFMSYAFASLLRPSGPGYLYTHPNYLPPAVYLAYMISLIASIVWTFLWDNGEIVAALIFRIISTIAAYVSLGVSMYGLFTNQKLLVSYGNPKEYIWVIALVHNVLGLYAMWLMIETLVNLSAVLVYSADVHQNASGSISLAFLTGLVVLYSLVDLAFFERYFRYLYMPMLVLIWAFAGILIGNLDWSTSNTVFTLGLIIVTSIVLFVKVTLSVLRAIDKPLFKQSNLMGNLPNGFASNAPTSNFTPAVNVPPVTSPPLAFSGYPSLS